MGRQIVYINVLYVINFINLVYLEGYFYCFFLEKEVDFLNYLKNLF